MCLSGKGVCAMKLESLKIQNLRAIYDETICFDDYTCFVGTNGSGKSTVLCALNILFRETEGSHVDLINLDKEDFHNGNVGEPIIITATFNDLPKEAQEVDFADYYRQGKLIITAMAEFSPESDAAVVKHYGQRTGMEEFRKFFESDAAGKPVSDLRQIYSELMKSFPELPRETVKQRMIDSLHSYEESHPELCGLILSQDEFYGFSRGTNRLAKYIQWVFVPAVKDASKEQTEARDSALGKLLARTVRAKIDFQDPLKALREETSAKYRELIIQHQPELDELSASLQEKIIKWAHPDVSIKLEWQHDPNKTVRLDEPFAQIIAGEGPFVGNMARLGHGLQRSYLLALLQELSMSNVDTAPTLLLGCEEPELYQHPPQIKHLANILQNLSKSNSQVIVTTHSPHFVHGQAFENVRLARKNIRESKSSFRQVKFAEIDDIITRARGESSFHPDSIFIKVHQTLQPQLNEMFFTNHLVLVEGLEDWAYITTYFALMDQYDEVRRLGIHIVPTNSKSKMPMAYAIAKEMQIPTFIIFDSDQHKLNNNNKPQHEKDNLTLLNLAGVSNPNPFPDDTIWGDNIVMWRSEIGEEVKSDFDNSTWEKYKNEINKQYGFIGDLDKNLLYIADILSLGWNEGNKSQQLERLCSQILEFAKR